MLVGLSTFGIEPGMKSVRRQGTVGRMRADPQTSDEGEVAGKVSGRATGAVTERAADARVSAA